jgi:nicotinamidase/pyrazinamidase
MRTVFFDVDTQIDFVFPAGALYVPGAEAILPNVAALNRHAVASGIPLVSTADAHSENDPEFRIWPGHCVAGTLSQRKPAATLVGEGQTIVTKQVYDMFTEPALPALLDRIGAERYVVYGVVTEVCVRCAVAGLARRGDARIEVVSDAIRSFDPAKGDEALREFTSSGAVLTTTAEVLSGISKA